MARTNAPLLAFNRGVLSQKSLARVDLDRTKLSAERMENWICSTQGSMQIRPGTKFFGNSLNDTGAEFLEFVASTDDVALVELTHQKMRIWLGSDAHALALLGRPKVDTTLSLSDTGWVNASTGGAFATVATDVIPVMTAATTGGVTITASSENESINDGGEGWRAADLNQITRWMDTGAGHSALPSWWNVDFGSADTGAWPAVTSYHILVDDSPGQLDNSPSAWRLLAGRHDTGTFAVDTGKWTLYDERSGETGWGLSEKRIYDLPDADTGTSVKQRHWRLYFTAIAGGTDFLMINDIALFTAAAAQQVKLQGGQFILNATSIGALAKATRRVIVSDTGTEHSLAIQVARGPVALRVGSSAGDDDYVREASLGTGYHNLAFTPSSNFHITLQSDALVDRIVSSLAIGDSGTVELTTPWDAADLDNVRYDQSADVVYVDCVGVRSQKIERRGTGRSWSVVDYAPVNGPFLSTASSSARLSVSHFFGNTTLNSDVPFFTPDHAGALMRAFHDGQGGQWRLGAEGAATDPIEVTGISDTGTPGPTSERRIVFSVSGAWAGRITIQRSIDAADRGFKTVPGHFGTTSDTGTFTATINDEDDNLKVWYRARIADTGPGVGYTSGVAVVGATYGGGGITGIARITGYNSNTDVDVEVLSRFSDTGETDNWQQGYWSDARGFPTAVALHGGRLGHAQGGSLFLSVADDFENFDQGVIGDAGPIIRTLGSGPVDTIRYLVSLLRLIIGTAGAEIAARSSSLDEPLTPDNSSAAAFSTQGSANLRAVRMDTRAIHVQRSGQRVYMIGPSQSSIGEYESFELTLLVPDLLEAGIRSIAIQRQPDTRLHCVLADGTVAILTYEPTEEVICWSTWVTDGDVERAVVLPGLSEDAVYYHIRRTINGATKRFLEKWALESECQGDTGLSWLADCAVSYTDTGRAALLDGVATHLVGASVVAWGDLDTGSTPHVDLSPDVNGVQTTYTVDTGGDVTLSLTEGVHHAVAGLPFLANYRSAKLAYAAEAGTALVQTKRAVRIGLVLAQTHQNGIFFGSDSGNLDPLPRVIDGEVVDDNEIHKTMDLGSQPMPGSWNTDSRMHLQGKAPRPVTVQAAVVTVVTHEKV